MYYDRFAKLCEMNNVKPGQVSKGTGVSTATLTSWKQGKYTPKQDKLQKIADFFNVSIDFLMEKDDFVSCPNCHYVYSPFSDTDVEAHAEFHKKYEKAVSVYGHIPAEETVVKARDSFINEFRDTTKTNSERIVAYESFLDYDFLLDVINSDYSLTLDREKHDYREISALRITYRTPEELVNAIRKAHGLTPIEDGYYESPEIIEWVQDTFDDPDMHFLHKMKLKMTPERFKKHLEFMEDSYKLENPDDDIGC